MHWRAILIPWRCALSVKTGVQKTASGIRHPAKPENRGPVKISSEKSDGHLTHNPIGHEQHDLGI
jgi:hypothetical protein